MGAEWFPPHERPAAAMVSNLMNFVGSSLSFMLPPCIVDDDADDDDGGDSGNNGSTNIERTIVVIVVRSIN